MRPFFRDAADGGAELVIPTGAGGHVVVQLTVGYAFSLACDLMGWLRRRVVKGDLHDS